MKTTLRNTGLFLIGCFSTGGICWMAWPSPKNESGQAPEVSTPGRSESKWGRSRTMDIIKILESASTDEEKLTAAATAKELPLSQIPEALEMIKLSDDQSLTFAAKVLLIHWGERQGDEACGWAWKKFRDQGFWNAAFREIGPAWASRHPQAFGKWALSHRPEGNGFDSLTVSDALKTSEPIIESDMLDKVSQWLVREDPQAAYEVRKLRGGFSSVDLNFEDSLETVEDIQQALLAFGPLDPAKIWDNTITGDELDPLALLKRWAKIDPVSLSESPYTNGIDAEIFEANGTGSRRWRALPVSERADGATQIVEGTQDLVRKNHIFGISHDWSSEDLPGLTRWLDSLQATDPDSVNEVYMIVVAKRDLGKSLQHFATQPPEQRATLITRTLDKWMKENPATIPDPSGWSEGMRNIWNDLDSIRYRTRQP